MYTEMDSNVEDAVTLLLLPHVHVTKRLSKHVLFITLQSILFCAKTPEFVSTRYDRRQAMCVTLIISNTQMGQQLIYVFI
jgi:hypothetical protein